MLSTPNFFFNFHHPHHFSHRLESNHIQDLSSYLLFESTGDSEADSLADLGGSVVSVSAEFNDAESCTDDTPVLFDELVTYENEEAEEIDEEMVENDDDEVVESKPNSSASIDSTKEFKVLNEVDQNRLFWETCLAS